MRRARPGTRLENLTVSVAAASYREHGRLGKTDAARGAGMGRTPDCQALIAPHSARTTNGIRRGQKWRWGLAPLGAPAPADKSKTCPDASTCDTAERSLV